MATQAKVLICDDDEQTVRALAREARAAGWLVVAQTVADTVFPLALKHRPEMIVLDVHQLIDGRELLKTLRRDVRTSGIRVVMVSGSDLPDLKRECMALGADAFVSKPFGFAELIPTVELPKAERAECELPEFDLQWSEPRPARMEPVAVNWQDMPFARATLLFADDSAEMVAALVRGAKKEGFSTLSDTTSTHVLELARAHRPDVIVLDLHQAVDGRDLLCDLKRDPQTRDIKVVMLSAEEDQTTRHECFNLGAEDYFVKPLDPLFFYRLSKIAGVERGA